MYSIAVYGGSFDPFHMGHLHIAMQARLFVDKVWIMPCYSHMFNKKMTDALHRVNMCNLSTAGSEDIAVNLFEIQNQISGLGTYEIMKQVRTAFPNDYSIIIGQDNADTISKWKFSEQLLAEFRFIVFQRDKQPLEDAWYLQRPHWYAYNVGFSYPHVSSTSIRNAIKVNDSRVTDWVHPDVLTYIKQHKLYI